ncbi:MAG: amidase [Actinomycetota bacterium]
MASHDLAVREELSDFEWAEATLAELSQAMVDGRTSARALAEDHIARIDAIDSAGPRLNSIMEINPEALPIAAQLDEERSHGNVRGPLHGIPVLLKDNIDTADSMQTSAGSLALIGSRPTRDAFVGQQLRAAGAVILGKTNLSEWANFRSTHSSSGWSGRAGQCLNPYALDRNPSGSSSGSAAAVAAGLAPAALGTETDGSIVSPAGANSIVGIKPTVGLTSRAGVVPIAHSQDVVGPMCRTVADAAAVLGGISGVDRRDKATRSGRDHAPNDYTRFLDAGRLRGARLGVWRRGGFGHDATDAIIGEAIDSLRDAGATIVDPTDVRKAGSIEDLGYTLLLYEFKADLNEYLHTRPGLAVQSLEDLISFNEEHADEEMTWFGQEIFHQAQDTGSLRDKPYRKARNTAQRFARVDGIDRTMRAHRLDAIIAPTGGPPWLTDFAKGDDHEFGSSTPTAVAGYPSITVPAGYVSGLPVGLTFIGRAWSEPQLIGYAHSFEQATKARRSPEFTSAAKAEGYRER